MIKRGTLSQDLCLGLGFFYRGDVQLTRPDDVIA